MERYPRVVRAMWGAVRVYMRGYHNVRLISPPYLPDGPVLLVSNHTRELDPFLVQCLVKRDIRWIATSDYYDLPHLRPIFEFAGVVRVNRAKPGPSTFKEAIRALREGEVVGVFPEGRIELTPELMPLQPGVAWLAAKCDVPVVPVWIEGTQRRETLLTAFALPHNMTVGFGPPLKLTKGDHVLATQELTAALQRIQKRVQSV